jgi:hypothetical protein
MKLRPFAAIALVLIPLSVAAAAKLPANVTTAGRYLDTVDLSYATPSTVPFSKLKLCVAEAVSNDAVTLRDSAGSFVGAATGRYYETNNQHEVSGGNVFKYLDDDLGVLIAGGVADGGSDALHLIKHVVKFELRAGVKPDGISLVFSHISSAQQDTGSMANVGFTPVGTWWGAGTAKAITGIEAVGARIKTCAI